MRCCGLRAINGIGLESFLASSEDHAGGTAADNGLFVGAVLYRYRADIPWRDLPERFGDWESPLAL